MEASSQIKYPRNLVIRKIYQIGLKLTQPSDFISEPGERRNARLLSLFLISLFGLFSLVNILYVIFVPNYILPLADLFGYLFMGISYVIGRSRYAKYAAVLMIIMFPLNIYSNILGGTSLNIPVTLSFLFPSYILASIWFSISGIAIFGIINVGLILLLPYFVPEIIPDFTMIVGPLAVSVISIVLLIISKNHRSQIEHSRQRELRLAYDTTLEGWAHALELRDKVTEGHSQRVTKLTLKLARKLNVRDQDLDHIRRGALLHDMGKMGISDEILQKPGPLTAEEFDIVKRHPIIAYDLLSPIPFLKKSLEIPYCHHEKWDGSGYPQGLKGNEIPISARIFAIVDVWDALLSDRPYRDAWPSQLVVDYIAAESGTHFDPHITKKFLDLVNTP